MVLVLFYTIGSAQYLKSHAGMRFEASRCLCENGDYVVFPYYYCRESLKGLEDKRTYRKIIDSGLEHDAAPLTLSAYRFPIFYSSYRCALVEPDAFGDDFRDMQASLLGSILGRTQFSRFLGREMKTIDAGVHVKGIGMQVVVTMNKAREKDVDFIVDTYKRRMLNICRAN